MSSLPFVRTMDVDVQLFASTKGVQFGETHNQLWSDALRRFAFGVGIDIKVVGFVKHAVNVKVECITGF